MSRLVLLVAVWIPLLAEEPDPSPLDRIFTERESAADFQEALEDARRAGVPAQALLEARFLFHVDHQDEAAIVALRPEFEQRARSFDLPESEIFATREDWLAVVEYVRALDALRSGDKAGFKRHITEAFWLSPQQGAAFAPHIERLRLDEAMAGVRLDLSRDFGTLEGGRVSLADLLGERAALLLQFWSPWVRECEDGIGDWHAAVAALEPRGVVTACVLGERDPDSLAESARILEDAGGRKAAAWLLDSGDQPLARRLRVRSVPVTVLLAPDGAVLFNGRPGDPRLAAALDRIAPKPDDVPAGGR